MPAINSPTPDKLYHLIYWVFACLIKQSVKYGSLILSALVTSVLREARLLILLELFISRCGQ